MKKNLLKGFILSCICCISTIGHSQFITLTDTNFINWLNLHGFAPCIWGNQMDTTCSYILNATTIDCTGENIQNIDGVQYFDNLHELYCCCNKIGSLPPLPPNLTFLDCYANSLNSLPPLPNNLYHLACDYNHISILPDLPPALTELYCRDNLLTSLPTLPNGLYRLLCDDNQLTSLPSLPASLNHLECIRNQLTTLPPLPNKLNELRCTRNQLTSLPALPDSMFICMIDKNPNLHCLPQLGYIYIFQFDSIGINCLLTYPQGTWSCYPPFSSYPICDAGNNTYGCQFVSQVNEITSIDFHLSPNPTNGNITITIDESGLGAELNIYDVTGNRLLNTTLHTQSFVPETLNYPSGVYVAELKIKDANVKRRWVKM